MMMNKKYYNTIYILVVGIIWNTPWKKTERLTIELFIPSVERMISRVANKKNPAFVEYYVQYVF